ncbi:hypothetical protein TNCV_3185891 [Trichonephila clavipes]|nr:hypothetical protein TNCV_3185891 [Trichonephila clavipes]
MPLDNKCRIGPLAGAPPDTCVRWSSALRLNRDSSLKMTRLQSVTLQVARGRQNPVDTAYDVGQWWRPIRLFDQPASLRPLYGPYQSPSAARTAAGYVLEAS